MIVIGSTNSSNTKALVKLAEQANGPNVIWINRAEELPQDLSGTVGVTAGASAPEETVEAVLKTLNPAKGVSIVKHTEEDEYFPPPRNLPPVSCLHSQPCHLLAFFLFRLVT